MTTRLQVLRSSTTQAVPAAGTRLPGELWTNFPDLQMGVIDASKTAQKLIAVRYFSTSANYAAGDMVVQGGAQYIANGAITAGAFNANQWTKIASMADVGAISPLGDSRIINGDMLRDQRNNGASGTAHGYTVDRWTFGASLVTKGTWQQAPGSGLPGFPYSLSFISNSAYTLLAGDNFHFDQPIEADAVSDFWWGTASAQPVTLSFWVFSTLAGMFGGSIANYAGTRSYPFTYSLVANVWTKIALTIPGDTAGTWVMSGNGGALWVRFDLGSGSTYRAAAGAWIAGNYIGATGAVSVVSTNAAGFYVTGVKLEIGTVATPFNRQSLAKSMADCQRYYRSFFAQIQTYGTAGMTPGISQTFTMRAAPTVTLSSQSYTNASAAVAPALGASAVVFSGTITATGYALISSRLNLDAEL